MTRKNILVICMGLLPRCVVDHDSVYGSLKVYHDHKIYLINWEIAIIPKCILPGGNDNMQCKQYYTVRSHAWLIVQLVLVYIAACMCMFVNACMHDFQTEPHTILDVQ